MAAGGLKPAGAEAQNLRKETLAFSPSSPRWPLRVLLLPSTLLFIAAGALLSFHLEVTAASGPFQYWTVSALVKVRPQDAAPSRAEQSADVYAARNEFEPFQLVLRAGAVAVNDVDVEVSDLRGPGGALLASRNITVYFERYMRLREPSTADSEAGEWPDPLIPRVDRYAGEKRNAFPFRLEPGRNQAVWIEVYVPLNTRPGVYSGQVRISVNGKTQASVPVSLHVWNFALPSTSTLRNSFGFTATAALVQHRGKYSSDADLLSLTELYARAALLHRISLHRGTNIAPRIPPGERHVDWSRYDREIGPQLTGTLLPAGDPLPGARATAVEVRIPSDVSGALKVLYYREWISHFTRKGWLPLLFNYLWDEPAPSDFPKLLHEGQLAREAGPGIRNLVTLGFTSAIQPVVDIWVPLINCFETKPGFPAYCKHPLTREEYAGELSAGKSLWWYQSCASHGCNTTGGPYFYGWPSYMIDTSAIANRILPWLAWKYKIQGELYFNTDEAYRKLNPWEDVRLFGGNGDGTLFYPGKPALIGGTQDIPVESIRLKLIREGLEDYEYLVLAAQHGLSDVAEKCEASVGASLFDWNHSPEALYAARRTLGEKLSQRLAPE